MHFAQIFFARPPVAGEVKTRLARFIGEEGACALYTKILKFLLLSFTKPSKPESELALRDENFSGSNKNKIEVFVFVSRLAKEGKIFQEECFVGPQNILLQKEGGDLGLRMAHAFWRLGADLSNKGELPILLAGTDQPEYDPALASGLAQKLSEYDAVLGPACDGGYYVIGFNAKVYKDKELLEKIFSNIEWSSSQVFQQQKKRLLTLGLRSYVCPEIFQDIDTFYDLCSYQRSLEREPSNFRKDSKADSAPLDTERGNETTKLSLSEFIPDLRLLLPVFNEAANLAPLLKKLRALPYFREIISADNGSTDGSVELAESMGLRVTHCKRLGYGSTCLKALEDIRERGGCDALLFLDADGSDKLEELDKILAPVLSGHFDFCLGARSPKLAEKGALLPHARFGNWLAGRLIALFWGFRYYDLGPMRAISWSALESLRMDDPDFGWTVQMQVRALKKKLRVVELPVSYRKRLYGKSKVSASFISSLKAGYVILRVIFLELISNSSKNESNKNS